MTTVIVTGANRGLGLEFTRQYAKDGARVFASCRDPKSARELNRLAAENTLVSVRELDVTRAESVAAFKQFVGSAPIDILINNAGIYGPAKQSAVAMDYEGWFETLATNLIGPLRLIQAFLASLKSGREKKVVSITSGMGSIAETSGGYIAYRTSKAGLNMLMRSAALELKSEGIIVVPLNPGWVRTDMGGSGAPLSPETSVRRMRQIIAELTLKDSGRFLSHDGREISW
jgi:NAD(P)-dependent dehydrogenase (short-subunit alcohol dehydrogenase family)